MPAPPALKTRLSIAFALDEPSLTASILKQRSDTWRATLTSEARAAGSAKTGRGPNGRDLSELSRLSREDAQSIVNTFNRELGNQIDRIYARDPAAGRDVYIRELETWAANRAEWKDRQIATQNRGTARSYAQQRFNEENNMREARYIYGGPPPRERECAAHFRAGEVDQAYVDRNPQPQHLNCPHYWDKVGGAVGVNVEQIWVG